MRRSSALALLLLIHIPVYAVSPLCKVGEVPYLACSTGKRQVLVCISTPSTSKPSRIRYQFGQPDSPELEIVASASERSPQFRYSFEPYSRGAGTQLRFISGDYLYVVYSYLIGADPGLGTHKEYEGVLVYRASSALESAELPEEKLLSVVQCKKRIPFPASAQAGSLDDFQRLDATASALSFHSPRLVPLRSR